MKIAILGSPFDPPHFGHQLISQQVLDFTDIDQIWLAPCYKHTFNKSLTIVKHRVAMTKMLINNKIKYCGEEIDNQLSGATIELMTLLKQKHSQHQFSFIIGSDNLKTFKKWHQWEKLLKTTRFLVFPRPGFDYDLKKYGLDNSEYQLELIRHSLLVNINISSTNIRERVEKGFSISSVVPREVEEYIEKYQLYQ
ncbi:nicotinate (nicotinamide) nucleotide adenylyltransferase [Candidatus Microgenomates bacterium]|nr:nicotinate (nicotinamide) nucleotide adenylyltransferase [Candidatus Microgenomates bacterium]